MEFFVLIVLLVVLAVLLKWGPGFDDPKSMTNSHLLSAIAGQADWLEKMSRAPIETQNSPSIVKLAEKRRGYIARLCLEVVSRGESNTERNRKELMYPGASQSLNVFSEVSQYSRELQTDGYTKDSSAIKAVREKLFAASGVVYHTHWEL